MGSRMMHYIVAQECAKTVHITDKNRFLLGALAADAATSKDASHYYIGSYDTATRSIDTIGILQDFNHIHDAYTQGYICHLICDKLWLHGFYIPWLKSAIEEDSTVLNNYHTDFISYNALLVKAYHPSIDTIKQLKNNENLPEIHGITPQRLNLLVDALINDLDSELQNLSVITELQLNHYVKTCIEQCLIFLNKNQKPD